MKHALAKQRASRSEDMPKCLQISIAEGEVSGALSETVRVGNSVGKASLNSSTISSSRPRFRWRHISEHVQHALGTNDLRDESVTKPSGIMTDHCAEARDR